MYFFIWKITISHQIVKFPWKEFPDFHIFSHHGYEWLLDQSPVASYHWSSWLKVPFCDPIILHVFAWHRYNKDKLTFVFLNCHNFDFDVAFCELCTIYCMILLYLGYSVGIHDNMHKSTIQQLFTQIKWIARNVDPQTLMYLKASKTFGEKWGMRLWIIL